MHRLPKVLRCSFPNSSKACEVLAWNIDYCADELNTVPFGENGINAVVELEEGSVEVSSWFDIWASLSAIANLCLDDGVAGAARVGESTFVDDSEGNKD